jgi:uncharacterized protein with beta-barrel porin domain
LNAAGILGGVDMSASGTTGTLSVGVTGGPATDILTNNNPFISGPLAVTTAASSQGNIVFNSSSTVYGAIGVRQPGGPFLLNVSGGNAGTTVNFLGPVYATALNVAGTGAVNFNSGSTNVTATNFGGDGTIGLAPNTTVIGALTTTAGANTGTLLLGGASVLDGAVGGAVGLRSINVQGGNSLAGVSATITGAASAYAVSLGTNTLNVGGALTIANGGPGGVINTTLASPTVYGNIRPVGATNLGSTLRINVTVPSTAVIPAGTQFNIIKTQAGTLQSGTDGSVVNITVQNPTNPLYTFQAVPLAGTIAGEVTIRTLTTPLAVPIAPPAGVVLPTTAPVAAIVAQNLVGAVDRLSDTSPSDPRTADLLASVGAINALTDASSVVHAVAQLSPSTASLASSLIAFQTARQFQNLWQSRLGTILCNDAARPEGETKACEGNAVQSNWWLKAFGYAGSQGARQSFAAYDSTIIGTMVGYDVAVGTNTRVGFGLGFGQSSVDESGSRNSTSFQTYQATAYIGHRSGPFFVSGDASVGLNQYDGRRQISFPGINRTALAQYGGQNYDASVNAGYDIPIDRFVITPLASLQYTNLQVNSYNESSAGALSLRVAHQSYNFLESGLGAKVSREFTTSYGALVPEIHGKWLHELSNPTLSQTATFSAPGSNPFKTPGLKTGADTLNAGVSVALYSCTCGTRSWSVETGYDYYHRSDKYDAHQGLIKLTGHF